MADLVGYEESIVPSGGGQVIVTHVSRGPSKFFVRFTNSTSDYDVMRSKIDQSKLLLLPVTPTTGTCCIAKIDDECHRGLVLSTLRDQKMSHVRLVDSGCILTLPHDKLFQIPRELIAFRQMSISVALAGGQLSQKPGLDKIFTAEVSKLGPLMCQVVKKTATHHIVNLFDERGQNLSDIVLDRYNKQLEFLSPASHMIKSRVLPASGLFSRMNPPSLRLVEGKVEESTHANEEEKEALFHQKLLLAIEMANRSEEVRKLRRDKEEKEVLFHQKILLAMEMAKRNEEVRQLGDRNNEEQQELNHLASQKEDMKKEFLINRKYQLERDIAQKKSVIGIRSEEVRNLQAELDSLTTTLNQLEVQKSEEQDRIRDIASQIEIIKNQRESLISQRLVMESSLDVIKANMVEQEALLEICSEEHRKLRVKVDCLTATRTQLELKLKECQERHCDLASQDEDFNLLTEMLETLLRRLKVAVLDKNQEGIELGSEDVRMEQLMKASIPRLEKLESLLPQINLLISQIKDIFGFASDEAVPVDLSKDEPLTLISEDDGIQPNPDSRIELDRAQSLNVGEMEQKQSNSIQIGVVLVTFQHVEDVEAVPVPVPELAPLPIVVLLEEGSSDPAAVQEERTVSVFVDEEPSESCSMTNHPILTVETALIGSVIEEQHAVSVVTSDEPSVSILLEGEEVGAPVTVEDVEEDDDPASPFLDVASDSLATSEHVADEEEETDTDLKGEMESKPDVTESIAHEEAVDNKRPTVAQLMLEAMEEEEEEATSNITELVDLDGGAKSLEEQPAESVEEDPTPVKSVGAGTSDVKEGGDYVDVEVEKEGDPLSLTTPAGLYVSHKVFELRSDLEDIKSKVGEATLSLQADSILEDDEPEDVTDSLQDMDIVTIERDHQVVATEPFDSVASDEEVDEQLEPTPIEDGELYSDPEITRSA